MNVVVLMGRLTREPEIRYAQDNSTQVARFTLAVDRGVRRQEDNNQQTADYISCVAFGKEAEFSEKYLKKGTKVTVLGHIRTGSYTNREGRKIYTTDVLLEKIEFAEGRNTNGEPERTTDGDGFMNVPEGMEDELPFR